jgi:hypothetical protein
LPVFDEALFASDKATSAAVEDARSELVMRPRVVEEESGISGEPRYRDLILEDDEQIDVVRFCLRRDERAENHETDEQPGRHRCILHPYQPLRHASALWRANTEASDNLVEGRLMHGNR